MRIIEEKFGIQISLHSECTCVLIIEDRSILTEVIRLLYEQMEGKEEYFMLFDSDQKLPFTKKVEFILEPFSLSVNDRKILASIHSELSTLSNEKYIVEKNELHKNILCYLDLIVQESEQPLTYNENTDIQGLLKLFELKVEEDVELLEKIMLYLKLCVYLKKVQVIIFFNLKLYLSENELLYLYEYAMYNKVCLLLIEHNEMEKLLNEKICILDSDGCFIQY